MGARGKTLRHWAAAGAVRSIAEGQVTDADVTRKRRAQDPNFADLRELGKGIFKPIIEFRDRATADRIGALVIELVRAAYLDAIDAA
jgi:hypothetical protein